MILPLVFEWYEIEIIHMLSWGNYDSKLNFPSNIHEDFEKQMLLGIWCIREIIYTNALIPSHF